jgi:hypothetical protein
VTAVRWVLLVLLGIVAMAGVFLQREKTEVLRTEFALAREESRDLAALRAEHERLKSAQVSPVELERLRADRAAILRLRAELESLRARTEQKARLASGAKGSGATELARESVELVLEPGVDGGFAVDGVALDLATLRARLTPLAGTGQTVQFAIVSRGVPNPARAEELNTLLRNVSALAKELGLRLKFRLVDAQMAKTAPITP